MRITANGTGPRKSAGGIRSGKRISSPYASAFPAAWAIGAESAKTAATTHAVMASAATPPSVLALEMIARSTAAGATTRNAVSPQGRGASNAINPTAHAAHNNTAATRAGLVSQPSSASVNAMPAETGSSAHVRRAHHNIATVRPASIVVQPES